MDVVQYVYDILEPLNIPVLHHARPKDLPGISYHLFGIRPALHGDGQIKRETCNVQVDVWSRDGKVYDIYKKIKSVMKQNKFLFVNKDDDFEKDIGIYHKIIVFSIDYETEVD